jgi:hypothetical protein
LPTRMGTFGRICGFSQVPAMIVKGKGFQGLTIQRFN